MLVPCWRKTCHSSKAPSQQQRYCSCHGGSQSRSPVPSLTVFHFTSGMPTHSLVHSLNLSPLNSADSRESANRWAQPRERRQRSLRTHRNAPRADAVCLPLIRQLHARMKSFSHTCLQPIQLPTYGGDQLSRANAASGQHPGRFA